MTRTTHGYAVGVTVAAVGLLVASGPRALAQVIQEDGEVRAYQRAGLREYPPGAAHRPTVDSETVVSPGAEFIRLHFRALNLAPGDYVTISSQDGRHNEVLEGRGPHGDGSVWSFAIPGDTALVEVHAGPRRNPRSESGAYGYRIDRVVHGTLPLDEEGEPVSRQAPAGDPFGIESVCGTIGYENVRCQSSADTAKRPVARLLAVNSDGTRSVRCTGWLVRGSNANTLITNNHCFSTSAAVRSIEAQFNYETTTCTGTTTATIQSFRGNQLLRTVGQPLDYTLATLFGSPEATWGEIIPLRREPQVGELIWIIQHPSGQRKKIAHWLDSAHTTRCTVSGITSTQVEYSCDTEGGSSGSVVLDAGTNLALGLHHLGGCPNSAAKMANICAHAGSLLQCQ